MTIILPLFEGVFLKIAPDRDGCGEYPTAKLSKGLILIQNGRELNEEAVGFGVPIIKRGLMTVFPGDMSLHTPPEKTPGIIQAVFSMNLEERVAGSDQVKYRNKKIYAVKNYFAYIHRQIPPLRIPLTAVSNLLRSIFRWETTFEEVESCAKVTMRYSVGKSDGKVHMEAAVSRPAADGITEVIVMQEQGGNYFNRYRDSDDAVANGREIGTWDEVKAGSGTFVDAAHGLSFTCGQADGARLFRGRELIGRRLAWSGFGYVFSPQSTVFRCEVAVRNDP